MNDSRKDCLRIPVNLEAEFVYNKAIYFALIKNVSDNGLYVQTTCTEPIEDYKSDTKVNINLQLPSGQVLHLTCEQKWSNKKMPYSMIKQIGMKIINPPQEYNDFYKTVKSGH